MTAVEGTSPPAATRPEGTRSPPTGFTTDEVRRLADAFERCDIPRAAWTHHAHLVVALWYLVCYGPDEGGERVRVGIQRLNAANGVQQTRDGGYHETITRFYLWAIRRHVGAAPRDASIGELATTLIAAWGDRTHLLEYYSRE